MASEGDIKVGMALLDEVEAWIVSGQNVPRGKDFFEYRKELEKQCKLAESKFGDYRPGLARSWYLKGRLNGNYSEHLEKAMELGYDEFEIRQRLAKQYAALGKKQKALEHYRWLSSEVKEEYKPAIEAEIAKIEAKKGCFIATATYDSPQAPQVLVFRSFRDNVLLHSTLGEKFVDSYYLLSPPFAKLISKSAILRSIVRNLLLEQILFLLKFYFRTTSKKER